MFSCSPIKLSIHLLFSLNFNSSLFVCMFYFCSLVFSNQKGFYLVVLNFIFFVSSALWFSPALSRCEYIRTGTKYDFLKKLKYVCVTWKKKYNFGADHMNIVRVSVPDTHSVLILSFKWCTHTPLIFSQPIFKSYNF
jgi:hypothetical protein